MTRKIKPTMRIALRILIRELQMMATEGVPFAHRHRFGLACRLAFDGSEDWAFWTDFCQQAKLTKADIVECKMCLGIGHLREDEDGECPVCKGLGVV